MAMLSYFNVALTSYLPLPKATLLTSFKYVNLFKPIDPVCSVITSRLFLLDNTYLECANMNRAFNKKHLINTLSSLTCVTVFNTLQEDIL